MSFAPVLDRVDARLILASQPMTRWPPIRGRQRSTRRLSGGGGSWRAPARAHRPRAPAHPRPGGGLRAWGNGGDVEAAPRRRKPRRRTPGQIQDGINGVLVDDPRDIAGFGGAMADLLLDPQRAKRLGDTGQQLVRDRFLPDQYLSRWVERWRLAGDMTDLYAPSATRSRQREVSSASSPGSFPPA